MTVEVDGGDGDADDDNDADEGDKDVGDVAVVDISDVDSLSSELDFESFKSPTVAGTLSPFFVVDSYHMPCSIVDFAVPLISDSFVNCGCCTVVATISSHILFNLLVDVLTCAAKITV